MVNIGTGSAFCKTVAPREVVGEHGDRRGQGIGSELVRQLIKDDTDITWVLRAGRGSDRFWMKMGFTPSTVAMERCRL